MAQESEQSESTGYPGDVLVAASGFIVTGAAWGLFGYLSGELSASMSEAIFYVMTLLHILTGVTIFARRVFAVPVGALIAFGGLVFAVIITQWVLVFTNGVILLLLLLARANVSARPKAAE